MPKRVSSPADAQWHFQQHLKWIHRTWPETRDVLIELEAYWTGRVAMRQQEFPGMYQLDSVIYGLMHFDAWGNVMATVKHLSGTMIVIPNQMKLSLLKWLLGRPCFILGQHCMVLDRTRRIESDEACTPAFARTAFELKRIAACLRR